MFSTPPSFAGVVAFLPDWPVRLLGGHKFNRHGLDEAFQPLRAILHASLLARDVADYNQAFVAALADGVRNIFDGLPLTRFANQQNLDVVSFETVRLGFEAGGPGRHADLRHLHRGIADHAHHGRIEFPGDFVG